MPTIKANIADYLTQIEALTTTNLQILKSINDSFFTKKSHLFTEVDDTTYVMPSFISLENKINMLQENFENLVKSPETGEAYFNFDGNTRAIEVRKYNYAPDSITLPTVNSYGVESNNIFKDFLTPVPYINIDLPNIPNDVVEVNVKKVVAKSNTLKSIFKSLLAYTEDVTDANGNVVTQTLYNTSVNNTYANIHKLLANYTNDSDFVEYDTIYKLPIRKNIGTATYVIESVISDVIDEDLNELITLKLRNNLTDSKLSNRLTYKLFDETIEKPLQVGDELVNFDGTGKVVITDVRTATNTITVKVVNGEYLNFIGTDSYDTDNDNDIHDLSKLRFYSAIDFNANRYLKIPLEEDQYVFVAVAVLNSRMNVQGSWGTGIVVDTYSLKNGNTPFKTYYDNNVKNLGDVLFEMSSTITSPITSLSSNVFNGLQSFKPTLKNDFASVMQINKHLNNSDTVKNIRAAYNQKKNAETALSEVQGKINDINTKLASIAFDDTNSVRSTYVAQLNKLTSEKDELLSSINAAINSISLSANSSELPIENAKYRIRGFYVPEVNILDTNYSDHIIGIKVQYRYKNISNETGNAVTINSASGNNTYIYSDWNNMQSFNKSKTINQVDGMYVYEYESNNEDRNEPSYNQVDIPISQGETVDIRIKLIYDFGQPYITMTSDWSNIVSIGFPDELTADVPILSIIESNNSDIETNKFNNVLENNGINSHINDMLVDQNITYYHKPESIASGFYTNERKIIPLKDKLQSICNDIAAIKSEVNFTQDNCKINLAIGNNNTNIYSDRDNIISLEAYNNFKDGADGYNGVYSINEGIVSTFLNLSIANTGTTAMKLYSLFPGNRGVGINDTTTGVVNKEGYITNGGGVYFKYNNGVNQKLQTQNQFITFRTKDLWTGESYYSPTANSETPNMQSSTGIENITGNTAMVIYPFLSTEYGLCIDSDNARSYIVINPGDEIVIPLYCEYKVDAINGSITKVISFDLRTNLYSEPINYTIKINAKNTATVQDRLTTNNKNRMWERLTNAISYKQTIK
jgi:hypothetical protein